MTTEEDAFAEIAERELLGARPATETKTPQERLREKAHKCHYAGTIAVLQREHDVLFEAAAELSIAADALDAKDALLVEARKFVFQLIQAGAVDKSIKENRAFDSVDLAWFVARGRALLLKLTEATP